MSSAVTNGYKRASPPGGDELYGPEPYDLNFCIPIDFTGLETERVSLQPFLPRIHAPAYFEQVSKNPHLEEWMVVRTDTLEQFLARVEASRRHPGHIMLAIIDKGRPGQEPQVPEGSFAGVIGLRNLSASTLDATIGPVMIFPPFQRTYVNSNAVGLLLRYCLELPSKGGLGLRRVQWNTNLENQASMKAATRMGFKQEAVLRWTSALQDEKKVGHGRPLRQGDPLPHKPGRDSVRLSFTFEEWESGGRELVQALIERK